MLTNVEVSPDLDRPSIAQREPDTSGWAHGIARRLERLFQLKKATAKPFNDALFCNLLSLNQYLAQVRPSNPSFLVSTAFMQ